MSKRLVASHRPAPRDWLRRLGWMAVIWLASVVALGVMAYGLRLLMRLAGLAA